MSPAPAPILVIGESLVDVVRHPDGSTSEHPGGSPANVAVGLVRLGARVELATAYAADRLGELLAAHLASAGVEYAGDPRILDRTSTARATIGADGSAAYAFDLDGRLPVPSPSALPVHVHVGSISAVLEPGTATIADALAGLGASATISYDVNARPGVTGVGADVVARVEAIVARSDVVKASDEDLEALFPEQTIGEAVQHLRSLGARAVVLTRGGAGATCMTDSGVIEVPARPVTVVDTIGAGDSFCAAMLDGLRREGVLGDRQALRALPEDGWRGVLERAGRAAAITVSRAGANPPTTDELDVRSSA